MCISFCCMNAFVVHIRLIGFYEFFQRPKKLDGLDTVKFHKQPAEEQAQSDGDLSPKVIIPDIVVPGYSPLEVCTGDSIKRSRHGGSFTSIKTEIREAFGAIMSGQSLTGCLFSL